MKKIVFSVLILVVATLLSCRKNDVDADIKQYDDEQIQKFIQDNGITGMQRDASSIYYKILTPATGSELRYKDSVGFVFTLHTFDGRYASTDTIINRYSGYLGQVSQAGYPLALQTAIHDIIKRFGGRVRLLIPSHLGYGASGVGTGSSTTNNTRIYGNQCLDYYVNVINDQPGDNQNTYDDMLIRNYMTANGLTGFTKVTSGIASGLYYKITRPGIGTDVITENSTVYCTYKFTLLNGVVVDYFEGTGQGQPFEVPELVPGVREALKTLATTGTGMSLIIPSSLAYGRAPVASPRIPGNSCMRFDVQVLNIIP